MTATVVLPTALRGVAGGRGEVAVDASTVAQALDVLAGSLPQLERRVRDEQGVVRSNVMIFVGEVDIRELSGLATPLADGARVYLIPAVAGGVVSARWVPGPRPAAGPLKGGV